MATKIYAVKQGNFINTVKAIRKENAIKWFLLGDRTLKENDVYETDLTDNTKPIEHVFDEVFKP